jgi:hypothetical protein
MNRLPDEIMESLRDELITAGFAFFSEPRFYNFLNLAGNVFERKDGGTTERLRCEALGMMLVGLGNHLLRALETREG